MDKATPWSALPLGKIVVASSLSLAPAITGRYDPTLPATVEEPTPRTDQPPGVAHQPTSHLDQDLDAPQRPVLDRVGRHNRRRKFPRLYAKRTETDAPGWPRTDRTAESSSASALFDCVDCPTTIVGTTPSGPADMFVTMKPARLLNSSPLCHSTLAPSTVPYTSSRITGRSRPYRPPEQRGDLPMQHLVAAL